MRNLLAAGLRKLRSGELNRPQGDRQARVLAIAAQKGGVGKTTTAVNLACALARYHGHRVLLIDCDAQGHVAASLRASVRSGPITLSDVLLATRPRDLMEAAVESEIEGLWLTPTDKALQDTDTQLTSRVGREHLLRAAMRTARTHFDTILLDCPPNLGNLTLNALVSADWVVIPCDMSVLALEGVADLIGTVGTVRDRLGQPLRVLGVLKTRVDGRNLQINQTVGAALVANFGELVLEGLIPVNSALAKAQAGGLSIFQFQPRSRAAVAYRALAGELLDRLAIAGGDDQRAAT